MPRKSAAIRPDTARDRPPPRRPDAHFRYGRKTVRGITGIAPEGRRRAEPGAAARHGAGRQPPG